MQGMIKLDSDETIGRSAVVGEHDVGQYAGWRVVAVLYTDHVERLEETEDQKDAYGNKTGGSTHKTRGVVVSEPRFLIVQGTDTAIDELTHARDSFHAQLMSADKLLIESELKATKLEKELGETKEKLRLRERAEGVLTKEAEEIRALRRKLEGDIGKIRTAIGEKQMKEILTPQ